jgi:hypothetical protein
VAVAGVWSGVVVVVEADVEGAGAFGAVGVEAAVGPVVDEGLDEALGLAVGARPVGAGEGVLEAELLAGETVLVGA